MYVCGRLGSEVTVVEYLDTITPGIDKEIASNFLKVSPPPLYCLLVPCSFLSHGCVRLSL